MNAEQFFPYEIFIYKVEVGITSAKKGRDRKFWPFPPHNSPSNLIYICRGMHTKTYHGRYMMSAGKA